MSQCTYIAENTVLIHKDLYGYVSLKSYIRPPHYIVYLNNYFRNNMPQYGVISALITLYPKRCLFEIKHYEMSIE